MPAFAHFDRGVPSSMSLCLASFIVSEDDEGLLVGRMQSAEQWSPLDTVESIAEVIESGRWVLPASHLQVGETPLAAARRIAQEQLQAASFDLRDASVFSHSRPIPGRRRSLHWDLCFVFEAEIKLAGTPSWFAELKRLPPRYLYHGLFARGHGDIVADMGFLPPVAKVEAAGEPHSKS